MIQRRSASVAPHCETPDIVPVVAKEPGTVPRPTIHLGNGKDECLKLQRNYRNKLAFFHEKTAARPVHLLLALKFLSVSYFVWTAFKAMHSTMTFDLASARHLGAELPSTHYYLYQDQPLLHDVSTLGANAIYSIPESHPQVGDRSNSYAFLRREYDRQLPFSPSRSLAAVSKIRAKGTAYDAVPIKTGGDRRNEAYDIHNCPDTPPDGYPFEWRLSDILSAWPPRDTSSKPQRFIYQGLCVFQYPRDLKKAQSYREQEVPFVMQGDPHVARTVERWHTPGYMDEMLGRGVLHRTEYSPDNRFLYRTPGTTQGKADLEWMSYSDWLQKANVTDDKTGPDKEHWYFRLIGCGTTGGGQCDRSSSEYLFDELPFFQPTHATPKTLDSLAGSTELYMGNYGQEQHGIHCRFGMKGVIAENHYDSSRNSIVLLGGSRRYILSHPKNCGFMSLFPPGHPSARHSNFDWSDGDPNTFPSDFAKQARGNEVVLQAGDVLYLPTFWFHYIVSLELNYQCNTRSGYGEENEHYIRQCGV